jgi:ubiquinone/menaquinone biosynthesis C-methylase UbiE
MTTYPLDISANLLSYEASLFWFKMRKRLFAFVLDRFFADADNFIEIGCGNGSVLQALAVAKPAMRLAGADINISSLEQLRQRLPRLELVRADANALPFGSRFGVVGAFDVLEHFEDDLAVLKELHRIVRPGGGIIITVPQHAWLWSATDSFAHHVRRYSRSELETRMNTAGFRAIYITSFVSLLFPLMCLSRIKLKMTSRKDVRERFLGELELSTKLNRMFEVICLVEEGMIRHGVCFPVGGSLLAVGIKE